MLHDIIEVKVISDYKLFVRFEDGTEGEVNISDLVPFEGVFEKLKDKTFFNNVKVNPEIGTIVWENGADIAPEFLYKQLT